MSVIVKVQKPLATNDPSQIDVALVYAKGRKWMVQMRLDHASNVAMGGDARAVFEAEYRPSVGRWSIGKRVKDRDW